MNNPRSYKASMRIDSLSEDDIDVNDNHKLIVETDSGRGAEFLVTISSSCDFAEGKIGYECDLQRDEDCRCNADNECCNANPAYEGLWMCEECIIKRAFDSKDDDENCMFCNHSGNKCMTFLGGSKSASLTG